MRGKSIFTGLLSLGPEDYLTEIFVRTLKRDPKLRRAFVEYLVREHKEIEGVSEIESIESQPSYGGDCPDVEIRALDGRERRIEIFIESKVDSREHDKQLPRYASLLDTSVREGKVDVGLLVYLTRDYDPKNEDDILPTGNHVQVEFGQKRWSDVHKWLIASLPTLDAAERAWPKELATYLEDNAMDAPTRFTPDNLEGLSKLPDTIRVLEACLDGEPSDKLRSLGNGVRNEGTCSSNLLNGQVFCYWSGCDRADFWVEIGFHFRDEYPDVYVWIGALPKHPLQEKIVQATREHVALNVGRWEADLRGEAKGMWAKRSLLSFINEGDQLDDLRRWVIDRLEDLDAFKANHPELPWRKQ
ncbi:MAG: PD-(D/E)XK nuclease family protein [Deltaproteobacteria bacterium]|nr:PD-(D/E)XK nuclease family protein [Deltaproteobacteria bacterium]